MRISLLCVLLLGRKASIVAFPWNFHTKLVNNSLYYQQIGRTDTWEWTTILWNYLIIKSEIYGEKICSTYVTYVCVVGIFFFLNKKTYLYVLDVLNCRQN